MHYDRDSIQIVDVVKGIREHRKMFLPPDRPTGEYLAELTAKLAQLRGSHPATVDRLGNWWKVSSAVDWLREYSTDGEFNVFDKMVPYPAAGLFMFHPEVLLTAYANCVVSVVGQRIEMRPATYAVPDYVREWFLPSSGRSICFEISDD